MSKPEKAFELIVKTISSNHGDPFSIWQLSSESKVKRNHIRRILTRLKSLGYVIETPGGFAHRNWRISRKWSRSSIEEVLEDYRLLRIISKQKEDMLND